MTIFLLFWPCLVAGMVVWSRLQPATARRAQSRSNRAWLASGLLYAVALAVGIPSQLGRVSYWLPAAVIVAAPLLVASWRERRA